MKKLFPNQKILILVALLIVVAISSLVLFSKSTQSSESPKSFTSTELNDAVITLERTACYGTCPVYKVTIYEDGKVLYNGEQFVENKGEHDFRISPAKVKDLINEFYEIDYFSLHNEYTANITDLPTTITSIKIAGQAKRVSNYYGAPEKLRELEDMIDEVTNSQRWIGKKLPIDNFGSVI